MATGMAIMGFGGGAFIASPLSVWLMSEFNDRRPMSASPKTFIVLGVIYFFFMMVGLDHRAGAGAGLEAGGLYGAGRSARA